MLKPVKRPKSSFYVARGTINGKRIERSTGQKTYAAAKRECEKIAAEIIAGDAYSVPAGELTVRQAINLFRQAGRDTRFLDRIEKYFQDTPVADIRNAEMRAAANAIYPKAASATIRRQLYTPMKAVLNFAANEELCAPPRLMSPTGGKRKIQFFTPEEADAVLVALASEQNQFLVALVTGLFGQGMRMGEAITLDSRDVSLNHRYAILRNTKNGEERIITLTSRTIAAWSRLPTIKVPGSLFRRADGHSFDHGKNRGGQISKPFTRAVEAAGLDPSRYTPHICRHTWATWFYDQTKDVLRLKTEGGWKSTEYERYVKMVAPGIGKTASKHGWDFLGEDRGSFLQNDEKSASYR